MAFSGHAVRRMFERAISVDDVLGVIAGGEVVAEYPDDKPFPSALVMGNARGRTLHVVAARDGATGKCYAVTVYEPDPMLWSDDMRSRRA